MNADDVRARLREACARAGSAKSWGQMHGVSGAYISDVLKGAREPGESILKPLGLFRVVRYEEAI